MNRKTKRKIVRINSYNGSKKKEFAGLLQEIEIRKKVCITSCQWYGAEDHLELSGRMHLD